MQKDNFETERLVIKMLLIASNELNKEKWTYSNSSNFLFPNSVFALYQTGYMTFW